MIKKNQEVHVKKTAVSPEFVRMPLTPVLWGLRSLFEPLTTAEAAK